MRLISQHAAACLIGVRSSTLAAWSDFGIAPAPVQHGRYDSEQLLAWMTESVIAAFQLGRSDGS